MMDFGTWVLDAIERVGFPITFLIIGAVFFFLAQRQSSKRDTDNAQLHKVNAKIHQDHIEIQRRQNEILDKVADSVINGKNEVITTIQATKTDLTSTVQNTETKIMTLITGNHDTVIKRVDEIAHEIKKLPDDIKRLIQELLREDRTNEKNSIIPKPNHNGVDG